MIRAPNNDTFVPTGTIAADRALEIVTVGNDAGSAVETIELTVVRDRRPVLCGINLMLQCGETLAVMGPNGAGKSTLLKCFAGAQRPTCGDIRWSGNSAARSPIVRRRIGFVGHDCGVYSELTALENLVFAGRMYGVERPGERARKLLIDAGLEWAAHRTVGKLSQGMCRRLAIARALVHTPRLILLDEPFASLDVEGRCWLEGLFQQWRCERRTVCFVNHDIGQSRDLADRTVWLDHGRIERHELSDSNRSIALRSA